MRLKFGSLIKFGFIAFLNFKHIQDVKFDLKHAALV